MIVVNGNGRLAATPVLKPLQDGCVCEFRLLSSRFARGEQITEAATFFCFDQEAERFCEMAEQGQFVFATGIQETSYWVDRVSQERKSFVKYRLTGWELGPRPKSARPQGQAGEGAGQHSQERQPSAARPPYRPDERRVHPQQGAQQRQQSRPASVDPTSDGGQPADLQQPWSGFDNATDFY